MSITEQHIIKDVHKKARKGLFKAGTPLADRRHMKLHFTYKEFTLVVGVVVALIIVFTLWVKQLEGDKGTEKPDSFSELTEMPVKELLRKSVMRIRF